MTLAWMPVPLWPLVYALAAYRLTRLWTRDTLPPLPRIRQYVIERYGDRPIAELVDCPWCAGFWFSLGVVLVASSPVAAAWQWVAVPLAFSALTGLIASREG